MSTRLVEPAPTLGEPEATGLEPDRTLESGALGPSRALPPVARPGVWGQDGDAAGPAPSQGRGAARTLHLSGARLSASALLGESHATTERRLDAALDAALELARLLGIPARRLVIRMEEGDGSELDKRQAHGLVRGGTVLLHPYHFDPASRAGRALLAHELAHVAQLRSVRTLAGERGALVGEIEAEARAVADAVREGRIPARPRWLLPDRAIVADTGDARETDPRPSAETFDQAVAGRYHAEIARIKRLLRGVWGFLWVTDGMISEALLILQAVDFVTAMSIVRALTRGERRRFIGELDSSHYSRFRPQILALFAATEPAVLEEFDEDILDGMDWARLSDAEHYAVWKLRRVWLALGEENPWRTLRNRQDRVGEAVRRLEQLPPPSFSLQEEEDRASEDLRRERDEIAAAIRAVENDPELQRRLAQVIRALRAGPSDDEKLVILDMLTPLMREPEKLRGVARLLQDDEEGDLIDRLVDDFPVLRLIQGRGDEAAAGRERLRGETRVSVLLRLLSYRDPWRNIRLAEDLLSTGLFDWIVNDEEAYLAHQLARTVPEAMREGFLAQYQTVIDENVTQSVRESARWNFYTGGEGRLDQASIQTRLLDERLWTVESMGELEGVARMAIAAGEHRFLFNQSRAMAGRQPEAYRDRRFVDRIVEPFRLYNPEARAADGSPAPRTEYSAEYLEDIPWYREGVLGAFDAYVVQGLDFVFSSENVDIITRSIGGSGLNAVEFQDMFGGSFLGLRFQSFDRLGAEGARALEDRAGVNFIDRVRWDQDQGVLEMDARDLAIAAVRYPVGSLLFQAGEGRIANLHLRIAYPTGFHRQDPSLDLTMARLEIRDTLLIFSDSMVGLNRIELRGLQVQMGADAIRGEQQHAREGLDPGPTIFSFLLPGITPLIQILKVPYWSNPQLRAGLLEPEPATALVVRWDDLVLEGITTSGGQYIESIAVSDFQVGIAGTRDDYLEMLWQSQRSLTRRKVDLMTLARNAGSEEERARLQERIDRLDAQRDATRRLAQRIVDAEREAGELRDRQRRDPAGFDQAAAQRLTELESFLRTFDHGGMTLDAGRIAIRGLRGQAEARELTLSDVHGAGTSAGGILAALTESDTLTRIVEGERYRPPVLRGGEEREEPAFELDLGTVEVEDLRVLSGIPTVEQAEGSLQDARERLAHRPWDPALRAEVERLSVRLERTREYHRLAAIGVTWLRGEERQRIRALREALTSEEAFYAAHLRAEGARLTLGGETRGIGLAAERFDAFRPTDDRGEPIADAPGIRIGGGATTIGEIHGRDVRGGMALEGGLLTGSGELADRITELGLSGQALEVLDVRRPADELTVDRASLEDFDLRLRPRDGTLEARATTATVEGLRQPITEEWLLREIAALEAKPADIRSSAEDQRLEELRLALDTLRGYDELFQNLQRQIDEASDPARRASLEQQLVEAIALYRRWLLQLGARSIAVSGLGVRVSGLGNPLAEDFSFDDALERGITVEGTGQSAIRSAEGEARRDRIFSGLTITDARLGETSAGQVTVGETLGRVQYGRTHIGVENLFIESISVNDFSLISRGEAPESEGGGSVITQVWSHGTSTATGIAVNADLRFERVDEARDEYQLRTVDLHRLRIESLEGANLGYASTHNPPDPLHPDPDHDFGTRTFELASGRIRGIFATDLRIELPAEEAGEMRIVGAAGIEALDNARVNAFISGALDFGHANLNGEHLSIEFLESGERVIDIGRPITGPDGEITGHEGGLTLTEGDVRTGAGRAEFSAGRLRGRVRQQGDVYRLENVRLDSITLRRFRFHAGTRTFSGTQPTVITDVRVNASIDRSDPADLRVQLDRIHIGRVVSQHFRYEDPPLTVEIRQDARLLRQAEESGSSPPAPLEVVDVDVTNLRWSERAGLGPGGRPGEGLVEVERVHAAFDALKDALDLDVVVDAEDIDLRFLRNGSQVLSIQDLDATARGTATDGVEIDVEVSDLSTGDVSIFEDRIEVPNLVVPRIDINHLDVNNDAMHLVVPETGGRIAITNLLVDADIELDPGNAAQPVRRIVVYELRAPEIDSFGLSLTLKDVELAGERRDVTITTPLADPVQIRGFRLGAREEGGEGFVITPDPSGSGWRRDGVIHFDRADAQRLGVEVENLLTVTTNLTARTFDLGQLETGEWTLDLAQLDLNELVGRSGAHRFNVTSNPHEGTEHDRAAIGVTGIHRTAEGDVAIDSATIEGFVYLNDPLGLRVDIRSATVPRRIEIPAGGDITIPSFVIDDADFSVADLGALTGGGAGGGASGPPILRNLDFVNALNGTVRVEVDIEWLPNDEVEFRIEHGVVNLNDIENELGYDAAVDFDLEGNDLVLNIDWGNALLPISPIPSVVPQANYAALRWRNLTRRERERFEEDDSALLSTLIERFDTGGGSGGGPPDPDPFVELHNLDVSLWMEPTEVDLGSHGVIVLGGDGENAAVGIRITGNIPSQIRMAVEQINAHLDPARPLRFGGVELDQGSLVITDVRDTTLGFTGFTPGRLAGTIGRAEATGIRIRTGP